MININRGEKPSSLERSEIQTYLEHLVVYQQLSENDRKKAKKPDAGAYRSFDVLDAFERDFFNKCYLTEQKYAVPDSMDIEHFKPKSQFLALKYEWSNLYPCSPNANKLKPNSYPDRGYLDPCSPNDDVEKEIVYELGLRGEADFYPLDESNTKAKNTIELLRKLHIGIDENSKRKAKEIQLSLAQLERKVCNLVSDWLAEKDEIKKVRLGNKLKNILSRKSAFTMLLRSLSAVRKHIPKDFLD
jgi:hypothetical protein